MKCSNCGNQLPKGLQRCPYCGHDVVLEEKIKKVELPHELYHLSIRKLVKKVNTWQLVTRHKKWFIAIGLMILLVFGHSLFFSKKKIYQESPHNYHDDLIDSTTMNALGNLTSNNVNDGIAVVDEDEVIVASENHVYQIPLALSSKSMLLKNEMASDLNVGANKLYFISGKYDRTIACSDKKNNVSYSEIKAKQLVLVGNYLYYLADDQHRVICRMDTNFDNQKELTQGNCLNFNVVNDWLYYATDTALYRVPLAGGEVEKIIDGYYSYFMIVDRIIYYRDSISGKIYRMNIDGTNSFVVCEENVSCFLATERYLFFAKTSGGIFKQRLATGEVTQLTIDQATQIQLVGSWLYYQINDQSNEGRFVSVDEKSTTETPVYTIPDSKKASH